MSFEDLNKDLDEDDIICCDECGSIEGGCCYCEVCGDTLCSKCMKEHENFHKEKLLVDNMNDKMYNKGLLKICQEMTNKTEYSTDYTNGYKAGFLVALDIRKCNTCDHLKSYGSNTPYCDGIKYMPKLTNPQKSLGGCMNWGGK